MIVEQLIRDNQELYHNSITHNLPYEILQGTLPDSKLYIYLSQDLQFFNLSLNLLGKTLAYCTDSKSTIVLAKQIGFLSNNENDYFSKVLSELKQYEKEVSISKVDEYLKYLKYLIFECDSYIELITFVYTMEKVYLDWPAQLKQDKILPYKYQEWIALHSGEEFEKWVQFLSFELERVVKSDDDMQLCNSVFKKTVQLETDFFESCYNYE
ncbi:unnamed protein product [Candida verbasci]|uniref:Thiaminase-2/PQQC domain-containing protein n=1 Tax=Candida verbasci TaxID=1227364 RepID=A0A9W4TRB0_9ASCO|nr:unnamed protein product [Candida verbasci]